MGLPPFFCHNGDHLATPPPAHCAIPYQLDPKAIGELVDDFFPYFSRTYHAVSSVIVAKKKKKTVREINAGTSSGNPGVKIDKRAGARHISRQLLNTRRNISIKKQRKIEVSRASDSVKCITISVFYE